MKELCLKKEEICNLYFVGRNYADHIKELNNKKPKNPLIFTKPTASLCFQNKEVEWNYINEDIHYECEVVVAIAKEGEKIRKENVGEYISGMGLGIDFTDRKEQAKEKDAGVPWTRGKCQKNFTYVGKILEYSEDINKEIQFAFYEDNKLLQEAKTSSMLFSIEEIVSYISFILPLQKGDLIFTGTPSGVGPACSGRTYVGKIFNQETIKFSIKESK